MFVLRFQKFGLRFKRFSLSFEKFGRGSGEVWLRFGIGKMTLSNVTGIFKNVMP